MFLWIWSQYYSSASHWHICRYTSFATTAREAVPPLKGQQVTGQMEKVVLSYHWLHSVCTRVHSSFLSQMDWVGVSTVFFRAFSRLRSLYMHNQWTWILQVSFHCLQTQWSLNKCHKSRPRMLSISGWRPLAGLDAELLYADWTSGGKAESRFDWQVFGAIIRSLGRSAQSHHKFCKKSGKQTVTHL